MSWYFYVLEFVSGLLLTNGVPHFVEVVSGQRFQPPFGYLPGIGESSLLVTPFGDLQIWRRIYSSLVLRASRFCSRKHPRGLGRLACRSLAICPLRRSAPKTSWKILGSKAA